MINHRQMGLATFPFLVGGGGGVFIFVLTIMQIQICEIVITCVLRNVHNAIFETKATLCRTKLYILYFEKRS